MLSTQIYRAMRAEYGLSRHAHPVAVIRATRRTMFKQCREHWAGRRNRNYRRAMLRTMLDAAAAGV